MMTRSSTDTASRILSQVDEQVFVASFAQQHFWFLDQLEPDSTINTLSVTVHVSKLLTPEALEASLNLLAQRHEALRATFHMREGQLVQVIAPSLTISLPVLDLRVLSEAQQQAELQLLASEQAQHPFHLSQGPLLRCALLLVSGQSLLLLNLHRIICDEWSLGVFVRDLAYLYDASSNDQPSPLPPVSAQYAHLALSQRQEVTEAPFIEHLSYWKQQLAGAPTVLEVPTDRPRSAVASLAGASSQIVLPPSLTQALHELSQQQQVSLDTILVAAFAVLLARYSGQQELLLGTILPERRAAEAQALIGCWENPLALRLDLSDCPSAADLLQRTQRVLLEAQAHETLPFDRLLHALHPTRSLSHAPLFQVLVRLPCSLPALPQDWSMEPVQIGPGTSPFDLTLQLHEHAEGEGLLSLFTYRCQLFDQATLSRLMGHWQTQLPLLTPAECHQLLVEWTATAKPSPRDSTFAQLFEAQVQRTPEAVALVCDGEQLSYRELNRRANHLAHALCALGVGPEVLVALLVPRGIAFVVAILAVFKAGGAFLPLDPEHPVQRQCQVLQRSGCRFVLSRESDGSALRDAVGDIESGQRPHVLSLEALLQSRAGEDNPAVRSGPANLAYVMYTSGSTGVPKGVMVEQVGMLNHIWAKLADLAVSGHDCVAQNGPPCFDIVVWQCLAALLVGGRVAIVIDEIAHDPRHLLHYLEQQRITILQAVPSILRAVIQQATLLGEERPALAQLRWVVPTGDALAPELCRQWLQLYPTIPLLNTYGSTECSDDQCHSAIYQPPSLDYPLPIMSIGRPIQNMRAYVLDQQLLPVPIGVAGDLYIGGIGVGRGYLHDGARTAEVFVPDPFAQEPGGRLYKTRDRARYLADGSLEFLGRTDHVVKIHGVRIEPGEIEAVLERHAGVKEAVVLAREGAGGSKYLVAYIVARPEHAPTSEALRNWLWEKLPAYMVPSAFMLLDAIPLNANGKLDRKALPAPELGSVGTKESYVAPVRPIEQQLVAIWEAVLGVHPIGITDDFFELGGDSLLAVRLFDRIATECGKKLPLGTLFAGATIEQVSRVLLEAPAAAEGSKREMDKLATQTRTPLMAVQTGGSKRPFFFLHGQWEGGALYTLELARHMGPEQPFYLLEPYRFEGLAVPPTLEAMAAEHLTTLRQVQPEGPYLLGGWCNGALIAYEMARQLHAQDQAVDLLVLMDSDAPAPKCKWDRRIVVGLCNLFRLGQEKKVDWFLLYRHLRLSFHYWRLNKFKHTNTTKQDRPGSEPGEVSAASSEFDTWFPKSEVLRQDWRSIYDWLAAGYMPHSYPGKITFFWTEEEPWRKRGWRQLIEDKEVDIHIIPGNHMTSRTQFLPVLAEHLSVCLDNVQSTLPH